MRKFLKKCIGIILIILLFGIVLLNLINLNKYLLLGSMLLIIILLGVLYLLYKKNLLNIKIIRIVSIVLLLIGLGVRLYLLLSLNFNLTSDFALYYNTALEILNGKVISQADYLSYNGYVVVYSSIL